MRLFSPFLCASSLLALSACDSSSDTPPSQTEEDTHSTHDTHEPPPEDTSPSPEPDIAPEPDTSPGPSDTTQPDTSQPDTSQPDTNQPDTTQPDTSPPSDPCNGVSPVGECSGRTIRYCSVQSGTPELITHTCAAYETCQIGSNGYPDCVTTRQCEDGLSQCSGNTLEVCVEGRWERDTCTRGCISSPLGSTCRPNVQTTSYQSSLSYEGRSANNTLTGWSESQPYEAHQFLVISVANGEIIDSALTTPDFELEVVAPAQADGDDYITILTALPNATGSVIDFMVASPGITQAGEVSISAARPQGFPEPTLWGWSIAAADLPDYPEIYIPEASGSGAAHLYNMGAHSFGLGRALEPTQTPLQTTLWFDFGLSWDCGACFGPVPFANWESTAQMFIPGDNANTSYWGDAVTFHEFGHWWMASYGTSPGEGGRHILGIPTHPGLAWSEGFATWLSSEINGSPYYFDKQNGLFLWVDLDARQYYDGTPWQRPVASGGLMQMIDENEVASMLRALSRQSSPEAVLAQLSSPRMTRAPFARGYYRRTWNGLNQDSFPIPYEITPWSAPFFADFLDALRCSNTLSASQINSVTQPNQHYPYPANAPLCQNKAESPLQVTWQDLGEAWEVSVQWHLRLDGDLRLTWVGLVGKDAVIAAGSEPGIHVLRVPKTKGSSKAIGLQVELKGKAWGVAGLSQPPEALVPEAKPELFQKMAPLRLGTSALTLTKTIPLAPKAPPKGVTVKTREHFAPGFKR